MRLILTLFLAAGLTSPSLAIDGNPSKKTMPKSFWKPEGKRFSIFAGDPDRIRKANEVNLKDFEPSIEVSPTPVHLSDDSSLRASFKITFGFRNTGKKTYTLSFPDAKRYDMRVVDQQGNVVWQYSTDKLFEQSVGSVMVNPKDNLKFTQTVYIDEITNFPGPGSYRAQGIVSNYPEITANVPFEIRPSVPMAKPAEVNPPSETVLLPR